MMRSMRLVCLVAVPAMISARPGRADDGEALRVSSPALSCVLDPGTGLPEVLETRVGGKSRSWLSRPVGLEIRNEVSGVVCTPRPSAAQGSSKGVEVEGDLGALQLRVKQRLSADAGRLTWDFSFNGDSPRVGHEVILTLPILREQARLFAPDQKGHYDLAEVPTARPVEYAHMGWDTAQAYVLPLISVFDPATDNALTIALPADVNIPHLQVEWEDARVLRLRMAHRGMGGGKPSPLRVLLYAHEADYRSVLKAYADDFPAYFRPAMPRGPHEGAFWYHHIHDHPDFDEMARQNVRYLWASFWFTHLGEYLPDATEWKPYTYACWWKLGKPVSDAFIRDFCRRMHSRQIGVYAYFNLTEYGGAGDESGDATEAERRLKERFADAMIRNAAGQPIPTWEGAMAMNPGGRYPLWPFLEEQARRHLRRLPEIDGFIVDRLDWTSTFDYAHDDGLTRLGEKPAENLAVPVAEALARLCEMTHAAGKRVLVNQFYRVEVLRDVDGYCHENDLLPALGWLSPYRPAAAWHRVRPYKDDLYAFEAHLKQRLQFALMPQMIAREFPIAQQEPDPEAADLLERYAPLFARLAGKEQVLLPHCIEADGENDVNLFINGAGQYVIPLTSRQRFLSRRAESFETVTVRLRVPRADGLAWAHVVSPDAPVGPARIVAAPGGVNIVVERHGAASIIMAGTSPEPALPDRG